MTKEEILKILKNNKETIKDRFSIEKIGLFGSYANGDNNKDSDIDLVVEMSDRNYFKLIEFENYLKDKFKVDVDIGFLDSMKSYIRNSITKSIIYV